MNYTIYIRKDNWESFKDEENKSEVINNLLAEHYNQENILRKRDAAMARKKEKAPKVIKTPEDAVEATRKPQKGLCEHGQGKNQCFQPKCKNSRY